MKRIIRMLIFSALAIYLTSLYNKGFILNNDPKQLLLATLVVSVLFYIINPLAKIILLPINFLTLGLVSLVLYIFLFHFLLNYFSVISIKAWVFPGISVNGFSISKFPISYWFNIGLSAFSVSTIINFLEKLI